MPRWCWTAPGPQRRPLPRRRLRYRSRRRPQPSAPVRWVSARRRTEAAEAALHRATRALEEIDAALLDPTRFQDSRKAADLSRRRETAQHAVAVAEHAWLEAAEALEALQAANG